MGRQQTNHLLSRPPRDDYAYTLRAANRMRHGLSQSKEKIGELEQAGILAKYGTYGIDAGHIQPALDDKPLSRGINTRSGRISQQLGYDYSKTADLRKLYNFTQELIGRGGVAVDIWMTRMFFRTDSSPNRYQYDFVEGRVKHMAGVLAKQLGEPVTEEDVQAMLWTGCKVFIADKLAGYQSIIKEHGNDKAKKLLRTLDNSVDQTRSPRAADNIITYSGMNTNKPEFAASGHGGITSYDGKNSIVIKPIPYLTAHKVIKENLAALTHLSDEKVYKNGYAGRKDITGNVQAAIDIYEAHKDEINEEGIGLEYGTNPDGSPRHGDRRKRPDRHSVSEVRASWSGARYQEGCEG